MSSRADDSEPQLDQVLADYFERLDRGEQIDKQAFLGAHPELAVKLLEYLSLEEGFAGRKGVVNHANWDATLAHARNHRSAAVGPDTNVLATVDHTPGRSRGLHIRCPHCSNGVELLADTPFDDITCRACGSTFNLAVREDNTSAATALQKVGRFDLIARLGVGGFGTVWKARDGELDRVVAIKIPRKGQLSSMELEQFFREARSAAQLRHPNIVPVYEVGKEGETIFIVCEFVRGVSLADWLGGRVPERGEACRICQTVARALHHAHEHGVIHRDLKPSNVMLDQENMPHLMDFGLAKREVNEITMTVDGQILGTPAYMSPEQAMGHGHWTDRRTDIYSLGVVLFEMLTGEKPFRGNAQMQVHQRLTEDAPDPRSLNRHIPRDLATICVKCMERDPNRRYANAQLIAEEFERFQKGIPILARPVSRTERLIRWCKRRPALATATALTAFLAVAGPVTALRIEAQRNRLAELVDEKDDLIQQVSAEKQESNNQLSALEQDLNLLKGNSNPWEIWPMQRGAGPKLQLLDEVYKAHYQAAAARLESEDYSELDKAYGHLGLALLTEQLDKRPIARKHFDQAKSLFEKVPATAGDPNQVALALADCYRGLSRLYDATEKTEADSALQAAGEIYRRLGSSSSERQQYQMDELDAEMRRAVFAGAPNASEHLAKSVRLIKGIAQNWPTEPKDFYALVSQVTEVAHGAPVPPGSPSNQTEDNGSGK